MLQKFKITTCAFILCLFGLTLITASPISADESCDRVLERDKARCEIDADQREQVRRKAAAFDGHNCMFRV